MYDVRRTYLSVYAICWMELNGFAVNANANFASRECALHIRSVNWAKSKCLTREEIEIERRGMAKLCVCVCVLCLICKICCSRNRKYSQIPYVGRAKAIQFRINWNPRKLEILSINRIALLFVCVDTSKHNRKWTTVQSCAGQITWSANKRNRACFIWLRPASQSRHTIAQ